MIKMVQDYICYEKNCWSTKHSVLKEPGKNEDEHMGEDLHKRMTPHTHMKKKTEETIKEREPEIKNDEREDEHFGEDINTRIIPHSHKSGVYQENDKKDKIVSEISEKDEISRSIKNISKIYDISLNTNLYLNKYIKAKKYEHEEHYLISGEKTSQERGKPMATLSHDHDMPEYEEFLIAKSPIGGVRVVSFYNTPAGALKKQGLLPTYLVKRFSRY